VGSGATAPRVNVMNEQAALECLATESTQLKKSTYSELVGLLDRPYSKLVIGPDGKKYQLEINVFRDSKRSRAIRVMISIDDGGCRSLVPLTDSFIVSPQESCG